MMEDSATLALKFAPTDHKQIPCDRQATMARFSPCGRFLVTSGTDGILRRWQADDAAWPELAPIRGHQGWVTSIAFAPSSKLLLAADSWGRLAAWRYEVEPVTAAWQIDTAHDGWLRQIALNADASLLATCGRDRLVKVWSVADGQLKYTLPVQEHEPYAVAFHPQTGALVTGDWRGNVLHWDLGNQSIVRTLDAKVLYFLSRMQDVGGVRVLRFTPDGKSLVVGGGKPSLGGFVNAIPHALTFAWESGTLEHTLAIPPDGQGFVYDLAWNEAGFWMGVSCGLSGEGRFFFYRAPDAAPFFVRNLPNCQSLAVHPNGKRLGILHTNPASNANGRPLTEGKYMGNFTPVQIVDFVPPVPT